MRITRLWVGALLVALVCVAAPLSAQLTGPVVSGITNLSGTNPTSIVTGLRVLTACSVTKNTSTAPGVTASVFTVQITPTSGAGQVLNIYAWMPTSTSVTTMVASTTHEQVLWICTGQN